jgi:hypothetical protein
VGLLLNVKKLMAVQLVVVWKATLDVHPTVNQNAQSPLTVPQIRLVFDKNVFLSAMGRVDSTLIAEE